MSFPNKYIHRKVADASARACEICFKPSTSVLITPENKDFFYVCPVHLKDTGFCTPLVDREAQEAKRKKALEEEVARVKREYEEKERRKKEAAEQKKKDAANTKKEEGKDSKKAKDDAEEAAKTKGEKEKTPDPKSPADEDEPRIFELKRAFYIQRLDKKRQIEIAKRNRERLQNPNFFPSVPKGLP